MAKDRIRPLKLESPATGGTQDDAFPTEADPHEDYPDVRGVTFQNDTSNDEDVYLERDASDNLVFKDKVVSTEKTLSDLVAGGTAFDPDDILCSRNTGQTLVSRNDGNVVMHR